MRMRPLIGIVVTLGLMSPVAAIATTAQGPGSAQPDPIIKTLGKKIAFSPNDDGRRDAARVRYSLAKPAEVSVSVWRSKSRVRGPVRLGVRPADRHHWRWDGRDDAGRVVKDGRYVVKPAAIRNGMKHSARIWARVDTSAPRGRIRMTRPTVYPRATTTRDQVQLLFLRRGWNLDAAEGARGSSPLRTVLAVRDERGRLVFKSKRTGRSANAYTPAFTGPGRRTDGTALPLGTYVATITVSEDAGNRHRFTRRLEISDAELVEEVWTTTVSAAEATTYDFHYDPFCNGCGEVCGPTVGGRFAGGLRFEPCATKGEFGYYSVATSSAAPPSIPPPATATESRQREARARREPRTPPVWWSVNAPLCLCPETHRPSAHGSASTCQGNQTCRGSTVPWPGRSATSPTPTTSHRSRSNTVTSCPCRDRLGR